jgi:hypothetical protein
LDAAALEEARDFEGNISVFLINTGRSEKSPLLLASAAEFLKRNNLEIESEEGDITPNSLYAEALAMAKEADDADLVTVLEKRSRLGSEKARGGRLHRRRPLPPPPPRPPRPPRPPVIIVPPHLHYFGDPWWPW